MSGAATVRSEHGEWRDLGGRADPWAGPPDAAYLPPGTHVTIEGDAEVALCWAPAPNGGATARVLPGSEIEVETRGHGSLERTILPILMADQEAASLLVCEVRTPGGHWSSYPPHKHDRDDPPRETFLEETYYHRLARPDGFAFQRVYTDDRSLDETLTFGDRDCVLVPGATTPSRPRRATTSTTSTSWPARSASWAVANDPDHEWTLTAPG